MRGNDQVPLEINLFNAAQQETPQATGLLDLSVHQYDDRLALGVNPGNFLAALLVAGHAGCGVRVLGQRAAFRRQGLPVSATGTAETCRPSRPLQSSHTMLFCPVQTLKIQQRKAFLKPNAVSHHDLTSNCIPQWSSGRGLEDQAG